jgi:2-oxo-3-hexenedioate decarboxylase
LLESIDWVAHGFEVVQSVFAGWQFSAPDAVAAFGLHGALLIGLRHSISTNAEEWSRTLSTFEIDLKRNGTVVHHGRATNVLGWPRVCTALSNRYALTRALPVSVGETWTTEFTGVGLDGISVRFA